MFALYSSEIRNLSIEIGSDISKELYDYILQDIQYKRAKERALHLIERMDKTEYQIRLKLREGFYPEEIIDKTISFLKKYSYIDDERYAKHYIEINSKSKSFKNIRMELKRKGIDLKNFENVSIFQEINNEENERMQVIKLLEKRKFSAYCSNPKEKNKIIAYILRRGYSYELICNCINSEYHDL